MITLTAKQREQQLAAFARIAEQYAIPESASYEDAEMFGMDRFWLDVQLWETLGNLPMDTADYIRSLFDDAGFMKYLYAFDEEDLTDAIESQVKATAAYIEAMMHQQQLDSVVTGAPVTESHLAVL